MDNQQHDQFEVLSDGLTMSPPQTNNHSNIKSGPNIANLDLQQVTENDEVIETVNENIQEQEILRK